MGNDEPETSPAGDRVQSAQEMEALMTVVRALLQDHKKDEAIQAFAEGTGASLEEATQAVEAIDPNVFPEMVDEVKYLVEHGQKIAAIKKFREQTGANLLEAKLAVEAIASGNVEVKVQTTDLTDITPEIKGMLANRKKIEAIKLMRERTGMGLAEAKTAVEAIGNSGATLPLSNELVGEIKELVEKGEKIAAIKLLRERTGLGLAEAKLGVEMMANPQQAAAHLGRLLLMGGPKVKTQVKFSFGRASKGDASALLGGAEPKPSTCPQCGDPLPEGIDSCLACGWEPKSALARLVPVLIALIVIAAIAVAALYAGGMFK